MDDWPEVTLGDLVKIHHGFAFRGEYFCKHPTPYSLVTPGNFAIGGGFMPNPKYYDGPIPDGFVLVPGDLIVTMTDLSKGGDTLGFSAVVPEDPTMTYLHNQRVGRVEVIQSESVTLGFLGWVMRSQPYRDEVLAGATGTTVRHSSPKRIAAYSFRLPPPHEQQAIAEVLEALDDKIESNRRRAGTAEALLDVLASAYGGLDPAPLGDLVDVDRVACTPESQGDVLVDHFSLPAFDAGRLPDRTAGNTIKSGKLLVTEESVLVSRLNPSTNRTWFAVPDPLTMAAASTEFLVLRPGVGLGIGALWLAVRDEFFRAELGRRATGTSGSHQRVRPGDALAIDVPDIRGLQPAVAAEADGLLRLVHHSRIESQTIAELRDALLPELLSGRLRVPVAEELVEAAAP